MTTTELPAIDPSDRSTLSPSRPGLAYAIRSLWDPRRRWVPTVLIGLVVAAILVVHAVNIWQFPTANDDEGTYLAQAYAVRNGWGLAHYTYWYDHPPLAWIQLALVSWMPEMIFPDLLAVGAGRLSMLPVTAISLVLVYLLLRRLGFARWVGVLAIVVYGLSPLSVGLMRQIYLDGFAAMWMLAAMVLIRSPRRRLWHHAAAGVAFGAAVLSKETILVVLPALIYMLWTGTEGSGRRFSMVGFAVSFFAVCAYYPLYALLKGELLPGDGHVSLIGAWLFQLRDREGSGSIFSDGTDAHALVMSWLSTDPVIIVAGLVALLAAIRAKALRGPAIALSMLVAVGLRPGGYLPAMYVLALLPLFAVLIAGATSVVAAWVARPDGVAQSVIDRLAATGRRLGLGDRSLHVASWVRPAVAAAVIGASLLTVAPAWYEGNRYALTAAHHDTYSEAASWMATQVADTRSARVVVDSTLWLDLVRHGYTRENVIWFYKLDVDPAVMETLPNGWRDIDYVVATSVMRGDQGTRVTLDDLLANSEVVASFGEGDGRIDIHRVLSVPNEPAG